MTRRCGCVVALAVSFALLRASTIAASPWVSGYYAGYTSWFYPPSAVDYSSLTHLMVFAVLPQNDGTLDTTLFVDSVNGPLLAQELARRAHQAGKLAILTVGGQGTEPQFKSATSPANMSMFVANLVQTANAWGFDGLDIDWEDMPASDYPAVVSLVNNVRSANPGKLVTIDVGWLNTNFPLGATDQQFYAQLATLIDQMNVMTYGMADNWGGWVSWHSSAVFGDGPDHPSAVSSTAQLYIAAGVPAAKLGIGIGFYGSCWSPPTTAPLQPLNASNVIASDNDMSFANIKTLYYTAANHAYDTTAQAPYLGFSTPVGPGCSFISYEDEQSVAAKGQYLQQAGLGGTIIWQLGEGYVPGAADPNSLLHAVAAAFLTPAASVRVSAAAGSGQKTVEGSLFATPLAAQVVDGAGSPLPGMTVTFAAPATGPSVTFGGVASATVTTDANGLAVAPVATATKQFGAYTVTASTPGASTAATFSLTNTIAFPLTITATGGAPQTAVAGSAFVARLQAMVRDPYSNPVRGIAVTFWTPPNGASATFSGAHVITVRANASGVAIAPILTANTIAGTYAAAAIAVTIATPATFRLTNASLSLRTTKKPASVKTATTAKKR